MGVILGSVNRAAVRGSPGGARLRHLRPCQPGVPRTRPTRRPSTASTRLRGPGRQVPRYRLGAGRRHGAALPGDGDATGRRARADGRDEDALHPRRQTGEIRRPARPPRAQSQYENCTSTTTTSSRTPAVPLVHGSYQSGIALVDFTDPAKPTRSPGWIPSPRPADGRDPRRPHDFRGGDWSSYWYTGSSTRVTRGAASTSGSQRAGDPRTDGEARPPQPADEPLLDPREGPRKQALTPGRPSTSLDRRAAPSAERGRR